MIFIFRNFSIIGFYRLLVCKKSNANELKMSNSFLWDLFIPMYIPTVLDIIKLFCHCQDKRENCLYFLQKKNNYATKIGTMQF